MARWAEIDRNTTETSISVRLNLDGSGQPSVSTGIAFLDHMLGQLARHGRFDLEVAARGDIAVDSHHTAEDVAIALGQCFNRALGERRGIVRMAHALVPLDEALALVAVDLSGRGYPSIGKFVTPGHRIGELDADVFRHFLETMAIEARMNLHVEVMHGRNAHHKIEATFKALARALGEATRIDPRFADEIPSTKGVIEDAS